MDNILSLINQASSKDRYDGSERKSGKFGTGFITTHLLSEVVNISGILEINAEYSKFNISLDRTGKEKNEIIAAMEKAVGDLGKCTPIHFFDFDEEEYEFEFKTQCTWKNKGYVAKCYYKKGLQRKFYDLEETHGNIDIFIEDTAHPGFPHTRVPESWRQDCS